MGCWNGGEHGAAGSDGRCAADARSAAPGGGRPRSSGNRAFDEYRTETLRRLEDEQREFRDFLERLRMAKDKAEFDQFMAERRNRAGAPRRHRRAERLALQPPRIRPPLASVRRPDSTCARRRCAVASPRHAR